MFERLSAQRLIALFVAACALFNYPLLLLWNVDATVFGVALFPLALFLIWAGLIAALAWLLEHAQADGVDEAEGQG